MPARMICFTCSSVTGVSVYFLTLRRLNIVFIKSLQFHRYHKVYLFLRGLSISLNLWNDMKFCPFSAEKPQREHDSPDCPVRKHSNPDRHRTETEKPA